MPHVSASARTSASPSWMLTPFRVKDTWYTPHAHCVMRTFSFDATGVWVPQALVWLMVSLSDP